MSHWEKTWFAVSPDHTNGWWIVSTDPEGFENIDESGDGGFLQGTATFIASSPRLYRALENMLSIEGWDKSHPHYVEAVAALAEARGETP